MRIVVKLGGDILADAQAKVVAASLEALVGAGHRVAVVHGGGPQASDLQRRLGQEPRMVGGRRVTDAATLEIVKMVVAGRLNVDLCALLAAAGLRPVGLHGGGGTIRAERSPPRVVSGGGPEPVDFGFVGDVTGFDVGLLDVLFADRRVPVLACVGGDGRGGVLNINADVVAAQLACALGADKLLLVTSTPGVLRNVKDPATRISRLSADEAKRAIAEGVIAGGMIPKVEESLAALSSGVREVVVLGQLGPGDLERAVLAPGTVGTALVA